MDVANLELIEAFFRQNEDGDLDSPDLLILAWPKNAPAATTLCATESAIDC